MRPGPSEEGDVNVELPDGDVELASFPDIAATVPELAAI